MPAGPRGRFAQARAAGTAAACPGDAKQGTGGKGPDDALQGEIGTAGFRQIRDMVCGRDLHPQQTALLRMRNSLRGSKRPHVGSHLRLEGTAAGRGLPRKSGPDVSVLPIRDRCRLRLGPWRHDARFRLGPPPRHRGPDHGRHMGQRRGRHAVRQTPGLPRRAPAIWDGSAPALVAAGGGATHPACSAGARKVAAARTMRNAALRCGRRSRCRGTCSAREGRHCSMR